MQRLPRRVPLPASWKWITSSRSAPMAKTTSRTCQLICAHCNRVKGDRPQEYLVVKLRELGIAA